MRYGRLSERPDGYTDGLLYCKGYYGDGGGYIWERGDANTAISMFARYNNIPLPSNVPVCVPRCAGGYLTLVQIGTRVWSQAINRWVLKIADEVSEYSYSNLSESEITEARFIAGNNQPDNQLCEGPFPEDLCGPGYPAPASVRVIPMAQQIAAGYEDPKGYHFIPGREQTADTYVHPGWIIPSGPYNIIAGADLPPGEDWEGAPNGRVHSIVVSVFGSDGVNQITNGGDVTILKTDYAIQRWNEQWYTQGGSFFGKGNPPWALPGPAPTPALPYMGEQNVYQVGLDYIGDAAPGAVVKTYGATAYCVYLDADGTYTNGDKVTKIYPVENTAQAQPLTLLIQDISAPVTVNTLLFGNLIPTTEEVWSHGVKISWSSTLGAMYNGYKLVVTEERPARAERVYTTIVLPDYPLPYVYHVYTESQVAEKQVPVLFDFSVTTHDVSLFAPGGTAFRIALYGVDSHGYDVKLSAANYQLQVYGPPAPGSDYTANRGAYYEGEGNL